MKVRKQQISDFAIGDRIENTQQISYYYRKQGRIAEIGKNNLRVVYDDGSSETFRGVQVWLQKIPKE